MTIGIGEVREKLWRFYSFRLDLNSDYHFYTKVSLRDVHESVHRDTTMKITNKMHYIV